jgi:uncharacterized protein (TIGR02147 family)
MNSTKDHHMEPLSSYYDYRQYLKDFHEARKKAKPSYSYRNFCKDAGIKSPSLFLEVAQGKRNLTDLTLKAFIKGLRLKEYEARFFTLLVKFNQAGTAKEKEEYLEQMRGIIPTIKQKVTPLAHYAYYSKWYNSAIRELACTIDWKDDYLVLAKALRPRISKGEARESVKLLLDLGMIRKTKDNKYVQSNPTITTGPEVMSVAVRRLNYELAGMGRKAIMEMPPDQRDISSMIVGVSEKGYKKLKKEIQEFYRRVIYIADDDKESDQVFDVNVQLFPISEKRSKDIIQGVSHA